MLGSNILTVFAILSHVSFNGLCSQEGENCEVRQNRTATTQVWCEAGCCQDEAKSLHCCETHALTQGMVFGITVTCGVVVLAVCLYIRIRLAMQTKPPRAAFRPTDRRPTPVISTPEQDLPPPYWMCVSDPALLSVEAPPGYDSTRGTDVGHTVRPRLYTITEEGYLGSSESARVRTGSVNAVHSTSASSAAATSVCQGVVLQASFAVGSLSSRPVESAPETQERQLQLQLQLQLQGTPPSARGASVMPDETVVTFLPGHTSENVRPSLTDSSSANRVLFYKDKDSHLSSPHSSASNSQCVTSTSVLMDSTSIKQEDAVSSNHTGDSSDALPTREGASAS